MGFNGRVSFCTSADSKWENTENSQNIMHRDIRENMAWLIEVTVSSMWFADSRGEACDSN